MCFATCTSAAPVHLHATACVRDLRTCWEAAGCRGVEPSLDLMHNPPAGSKGSCVEGELEE